MRKMEASGCKFVANRQFYGGLTGDRVCEDMDDDPVDIIFRPITSSLALLKASIMLHAVDPYGELNP